MLTILEVNFGREFLGGLKPWKNKAEKFAIKIRHQNLLRNSPAISYNSPDQNKKFTPIRSA